MVHWLESGQRPNDLYQLVDMPLFHSNRGDLLAGIREASRTLLTYQNHDRADVAERARSLQVLLGDAEATFSNPARWRSYDESILNQIRGEYQASVGADPTRWKIDNVRRWLRARKNVSVDRLDEISQRMLTPPEVIDSEVALINPSPDQDEKRAEKIASRPLTSGTRPLAQDVKRGSSNRPVENVGAPPPRPRPAAPISGKDRRATTRPPNPRRSACAAPAASIQQTNLAQTPARGRTSAQHTQSLQPHTRIDSDGEGVKWIIGSAIVTAMLLGTLAVVWITLLPPEFIRSAGVQDRPPLDDGRPSSGSLDGGEPNSTGKNEDKSLDTRSGSDSERPAANAAPNSNPVAGPTSTDIEPAAEPDPPDADEIAEAPEDDTEAAPPEPAKGITETANESGASDASDTTEEDSDRPTDDNSGRTDNSPSGNGPILLTHEKPVFALAWSPSGEQLATAGDDPTVRIWRVEDGSVIKSFTDLREPVSAMSIAGDYLAVASQDGNTIVLNLEQAKATRLVSRESIESLAWLDVEGRRLLTGDSAGTLTVWDVKQRRAASTYDLGRSAGALRALAVHGRGLSSDGQVFAGHSDGSLFVWRPTMSNFILARAVLPTDGALWGQLIPEEPGDDPDLRGKESPEGRRPRSGRSRPSRTRSSPRRERARRSTGTRIPIGITLTPEFKRSTVTPVGYGIDCRDLSWSSEGQWLAVANGDVEFWDFSGAAASVRVHTVPGRGEEDGYKTVALHPSHSSLAAGDQTGELIVCSTRDWRVKAIWDFAPAVLKVSWSPTGRHLAVALNDGTVQVLTDPHLATDVVVPPFDPEELIDNAVKRAQDDEWAFLSSLLNVAAMYPLSRAHHQKALDLRRDLFQEVESLYAETIKYIAEDGLDENAVLDLQEVIDMESGSEPAERAGRILREGKVSAAGWPD